MNQTILIIGGGAAGLIAARELSAIGNSVILLEADSRLGGRIHTLQNSHFSKPIEAGAEFVHGRLPLTLQLLKEAGIAHHPVKGKMMYVQNGKWSVQEEFVVEWDELMERMQQLEQDCTLAEFLQRYFSDEKYAALRSSAQRFAEGFDLADTTKASVFALREEWGHEEVEQYRIPGGYHQLIAYLEQQCIANGCTIHTSCVVKEIKWQKNNVSVITADQKVFTGNKVIITVPIGILHANSIAFIPAIESHTTAAGKIGYGSVIKVVLEFNEPFWNSQSKHIGFIFSDETIPTWWTQLPDEYALLTGWLGGPQAAALQQAGEETILHTALHSLSRIFNKTILELQQQLKATHVANWSAAVFTQGAYSYDTLETGAARKLLNTPIEDTLFFAGEALYDGSSSGTVEAALINGKQVAGMVAVSATVS